MQRPLDSFLDRAAAAVLETAVPAQALGPEQGLSLLLFTALLLSTPGLEAGARLRALAKGWLALVAAQLGLRMLAMAVAREPLAWPAMLMAMLLQLMALPLLLWLRWTRPLAAPPSDQNPAQSAEPRKTASADHS